MNIIPKLSLNKHPKDCDQLSLVNARNIKISNDLVFINNEEDIIINNAINDFFSDEFGGGAYSIIGIIPCNNELVIFASGAANGGIYRYSEKKNKCKTVYSGDILNNVKEVKGTFTYNIDNNLIIAVSFVKSNSADEPLRVFNLGNFDDTNIDSSQFKNAISSIIPEVKLPSISHYYVKGSCYKGWNYLYVRFKINKTDYTQWYNFGYPIFIDDISRQQIFRYCFYQYREGRNAAEIDMYNTYNYNSHSAVPMDGFGTGCYDGFSNNSEISNTTFGITLNFNSFNNFKQYQLGFVCASKSYTKAFITNDIDINNTNYIFNPKYLSEGSINEFITSYYNYFNVGNIINYKNRLYIANYKEQSLNKEIDKSVIDSVYLSLKVNTAKFSLDSYDTINTTVKRIVTLFDSRLDKERGETELKIVKQYFLNLNNIEDTVNQSIPFNKIINVDNNINIIIKQNIYDSGEIIYTKTPISDISIVQENNNTPEFPHYCKIKINNKLFDLIEYCLENDVDENHHYINFKVYNARRYIITYTTKCIDTVSSFNNRLIDTTLIPGEVYSFYIHYIDKYGHATNGYRINNNTYVIEDINNEHVVPIKVLDSDLYLAIPEDKTIKYVKDFINTNEFINLYEYNKSLNILSGRMFYDSKYIKQYMLEAYGILFSDSVTIYDDIKVINIFNSGNVSGTYFGNFGAYINDNNERLFKIPDEEFYKNINYKYTLRVSAKIPNNYIGYFISYEKFESCKKVTGFLTKSDAREISAIEYYDDMGVTFENYGNNKVGNYMYLYSSVFDIKDNVSTDYNIIKIKAKSTKYCKINSNGNVNLIEESYGFTNEMKKSNILYRNSAIKYAYDLNKSLVNYTPVYNKLYGIDDYKLVIADSIKDDRGGLSTALQLNSIELLFISDDEYRVNTYIADLCNVNNKLYTSKDKTLIRLGNIIYGDGIVNSIINDGFNGVYTYDGVIVYNETGILFNSENNNIYKARGYLKKCIPELASSNTGIPVLNKHKDDDEYKKFIVNIPFLNYVQFPVIDTYYYESKHFNNNPQNVVFSIMKSDEEDVNRKGYWTGMIVEPKNSIDLFTNPQGSQDDFIPTVYYNYRDDLLNVEEYNKTVRRSNVIQDESKINTWRQFPAEGYKNINENKGIITNLIGIGVYILVHTEHSLFMFNGDATLKTQDKSLQLEQPDAFDTNYVEIVTSDLGFAGLQDNKAFVVDQFGYIFYNNDFNRFYKFDNGQLSNIDNDIYLYLQNNKPYDIRFANDKFNHRLLIRMTLNVTRDNLRTLSYNYDLGNFISIHDYDFNRGYNTKTKLYLEKDLLYNFTEESLFGTYAINNNKLFNSEFTVIINEDYDSIKFLEFIKYNLHKITDYYDTSSDESPFKTSVKYYCGDIIQIFNEYCNTGQIDISIETGKDNVNKFNRFKKPYFELGNWNFNYFRNNINSGVSPKSDILTRIYGNYICIRFIFDNKDKCRIEFENLTGSVSKQRKL